MNIAYLILAHHQPLQLKRLIDRLDQPTVHFYIHIDTKSKDAAAIKEHLSGYNNVQIISKNDVNWMGYSMVNAELDLLQLAVASGIDFKYYVLLSGQDYPIKDNNFINHFFSTHHEDFIAYNQIKYLSNDFKNKVRYYHFYDVAHINPRSPKKIPLLVYLYYSFYNRIKKIIPQRHFFKNFEPYFGSQWFALTHDTVSFILQFIKEERGYIKAMKTTEGPDELFFQTLILNSERRRNVYDYTRFEEWLKTRKENELFVPGYSSLRYMDWSERAKSKPAVLEDSYYDDLVNSKDLFARKFDEQISASLMDHIDRSLLSK